MKITKARETSLAQMLSKLTPEELVYIYDKMAPKMTRIREQARDRAVQHFRQRARAVRFRQSGKDDSAV